MINEKIKGVQGEITTIKDTVSNMNESVDLIVLLLQGNKMNKDDGGMIGQQTDMKKRIERLEKFKDRMLWVLVTAAGITGLNLVNLIDLVVKAFQHKP